MARIARQRTKHQQNFPIKKYGSWEAAEEAALEWLDSIAPNLPPPENGTDRMTPRNTSGVVGIHLKRHFMRKPSGAEYEYLYWNANWTDCPFSGGVSWPIHRHGDDDAFCLAVLCRKLKSNRRPEILEELDGIRGTPEHLEILEQKKKYV
jgi:hypothetical protein